MIDQRPMSPLHDVLFIHLSIHPSQRPTSDAACRLAGTALFMDLVNSVDADIKDCLELRVVGLALPSFWSLKDASRESILELW